MKNFVKSISITAIFLLVSAPYAWCSDLSDLRTNMMDGRGMGGGMMGGSGMMNLLKAADLNGDNIPEIVTISNSAYLVILDNAGNVLISKLLPPVPAQWFQIAPRASGLDVADLDGDDVPEIITEYRGYYATYLVILDNQGNLKSYKQIQYSPY